MIKNFVYYAVLLVYLLPVSGIAQSSKYFGFAGLNLGSIFPLGKFASKDDYKTGAGNAQDGRYLVMYAGYNISENYAINGSFTAMVFHSLNIENEFSSVFPEYQIQKGSAEYSMALLMVGLRRNIFINKDKLNHAFININSGIEASITPYDRIYYSKIGGFQSFGAVFERKLGPVFNFGAGAEIYIIKNLAVNVRADYYLSDLGTETFELNSPGGQQPKILNDIKLGLASRVGLSAGLAIHFTRNR